jgi:hypothetical protein
MAFFLPLLRQTDQLDCEGDHTTSHALTADSCDARLTKTMLELYGHGVAIIAAGDDEEDEVIAAILGGVEPSQHKGGRKFAVSH